jgi:hypothetical protein
MVHTACKQPWFRELLLALCACRPTSSAHTLTSIALPCKACQMGVGYVGAVPWLALQQGLVMKGCGGGGGVYGAPGRGGPTGSALE